MKIKLNNQDLIIDKPIKIYDLIDNKKDFICAKVNNRLRELNYIIETDSKIEFLNLNDYQAVKIYEASLRYIIAMALYNIDENADIVFNYSVSRSLSIEITNSKFKIDLKLLNLIKEEVDKIVENNYPIKRLTVKKEEALDIYKKFKYNDKIEALKYRNEEEVHLYECNGYINYMYSYMVPYTGLINKYEFIYYNPWFNVIYPRSENKGLIPKFHDDIKFGKTLIEEKEWINIINAKTVSSMNDYIVNNNLSDFVNMCETRHSNMLTNIGDNIKNNIDRIRLICVSGPSSSGKTTFSNRLRIELMTRGIKPLMISLDDYYLTKDLAPKDEDGNPDLEHLYALDVSLFNEHMISLINGEEVSLPHYDFHNKKRTFKNPIKINKNTPILIEGIHALNEEMTKLVPNHQKYKIYIAPHTQYHIDNHNPISITDIRLLRRLVRDKEYRNTPIEVTFNMWPSVRRGEFKWIYPYQDNADYIFNSELTYELCILKKHALPILEEISSDSEHYINANRLIKFLKYFLDIDDRLVPANSILREFIGGSNYC